MTTLLLALVLQDPVWFTCAKAARERAKREQRPILVYAFDSD